MKDEWIEWNGGECPIEPNRYVRVKYVNGSITGGCVAQMHSWNFGYTYEKQSPYRIVAYSPSDHFSE